MNRLSRPALVVGKRDLCGHRAAMGTGVPDGCRPHTPAPGPVPPGINGNGGRSIVTDAAPTVAAVVQPTPVPCATSRDDVESTASTTSDYNASPCNDVKFATYSDHNDAPQCLLLIRRRMRRFRGRRRPRRPLQQRRVSHLHRRRRNRERSASNKPLYLNRKESHSCIRTNFSPGSQRLPSWSP
jgi:hypothetical protein